MTTIVTRSGKGSVLTTAEMDANFTNLNTELAGAGVQYYRNARSVLPRGLLSLAIVAGGTSALATGTTYHATVSGGNFLVQPVVTFTVNGSGVINAVTVVSPGFHIGGAVTNPTITYPGVTGANITLTSGFLQATGEVYWTDDASDPSKVTLYYNNGGTPAIVVPNVKRNKAQLAQTIVPGVIVLSTASTYTIHPIQGCAIRGYDQMFSVNAASSPTTDQVVTVTDLVTSATLVFANGTKVPPRFYFDGSPLLIKYVAKTGRLVLMSPSHPVDNVIITKPHATQTGSHIKAIICNGGTRLSWDGDGQDIVVEATVDKPFGSAQFTLYDADGTTILYNNLSLTDYDGASPPTNLWRAGQRFTIRKLAGGGARVEALTDRVSTAVYKTITSLDYLFPSEAAPGYLIRADEFTWIVRVRPHSSHYKNGRKRRPGSDCNEYILVNNKILQTDDAFAPCINSVFAHHKGNRVPICNLMFHEQIGGSTTDNGQEPSTMENVITQGVPGANAILFTTGSPTGQQYQAGISHNYMDVDTWNLRVTQNDNATAGVNVVTNNVQNMPVGTYIRFDKLESIFTGWTTAPTLRTSKFTYTLTFESAALGCLRIQTKYDPTDPSCTAGGMSVIGSFMGALPVHRNATKVAGYLGGVRNVEPIKDIGLGNNAGVTIGMVDELVMWDEDLNDLTYWCTLNCGAGKNHKENGVPIDIEAPSYIQNFVWGNKGYIGPSFNDYGVGKGPGGIDQTRDVSTIVIEADYYLRTEFGNIITV